ncbi:MAG: rhomboid family intramembrane serine protease [Solirubrobacteraceae bacterium]
MASTPSAPARSARFDGVRILFALVAVMWLSEIVDTAADHRLDRYGIEPRDADGLIGVVTAPFLHLGFDHLISNTVPFIAMGLAIALAGAARVVAVTAVVAAISCVGTWLTAPENSVTIGASGIVFGYATYLIARGLFTRGMLDLGVGVLVIVLWGGALLGGLLPEQGISWQGHLFGAIGGIVAARLLARRPSAPAGRAPALPAR